MYLLKPNGFYFAVGMHFYKCIYWKHIKLLQFQNYKSMQILHALPFKVLDKRRPPLPFGTQPRDV